jgi:pyruvate ferredoxin oxidoreductase delta subunit
MFIEEKKAVVDLVYCKGCGICAQECSRAAIRMLPEEV